MRRSDKSRIVWHSVGEIAVKTVQKNQREDGKEYWIIRSHDGLVFSCFSSRLAGKIIPNTDIAAEGEIRFGRGSTYLVLKKIACSPSMEIVEEEKEDAEYSD